MTERLVRVENALKTASKERGCALTGSAGQKMNNTAARNVRGVARERPALVESVSEAARRERGSVLADCVFRTVIKTAEKIVQM